MTTPEVRRESMLMDMDYVESASLVGDLKLLGRTPLAMCLANVAAANPNIKAGEVPQTELG
ncbi:MAG TPA: hypothetical protein VLF59_05090 [Candidatus Saccharimonadales bacterium]|nr:hypothetical protein [Candidatus Saccharimonadales bacterium]